MFRYQAFLFLPMLLGDAMPGLNAARLRWTSLLNLRGSVIEGLLRLDRAQVAEIFLMSAHAGDGTAAIAAEGQPAT